MLKLLPKEIKMSFCKFSTQMIASDKTTVDNLFLSEFMPYAPENFVKVYLYGLFKCNNADSFDNELESFSRILSLSEDEILTAFYYWQEQGLVKVIETSPFEVRYLPLKNLFTNIKKYKPEKFEAFTAQVQEIITGRMITVNEYAQYYDLIEREKFQPEALLMLIKYCTNLKGDNIGYSYIVTVAKNWAQENITTTEKVEEKLKVFELFDTALQQLNKIFSIKRQLTIDEREMYQKWTEVFGFENDVILFVAKNMKKNKALGYDKLNSKLTKYYEMKLLSVKEISAFEEQMSQLFDTAKNVVASLGLYYENLEPVIENYIASWNNLGYSCETLSLIGNFCFKKSIRTLDGMNKTINKLYKLGLVSTDSIIGYIDDVAQFDKTIKNLLEKLGLNRNVNSWDRSFFQTWTENWKIPQDVFDYAVGLAKDKIQPMQYLNKILSTFHENNVDTIEKAKQQAPTTSQASNKPSHSSKGRSYSKEELNALFDSLEEFEV